MERRVEDPTYPLQPDRTASRYNFRRMTFAGNQTVSHIPTDLAASAAQAGLQAREVVAQRDARRAAQANAVARQVKSVTDAGNTVETTDSDDQVFIDAEGQGSQGRAPDEDGQSQDQTPDPPRSSVPSESDCPVHLDIEA